MKKIFYLLFLTLIYMCIVPLPIFAVGTEKLPSGIGYTEIASRIDSYFEENEETSAGMSVAVFTDDYIIHEGYYGYADKENNIAVNTNTVMEWGSAILVWVSVMQLVEKGELSLEDDIKKYLPEGFLTKLKSDTPLTMYNLMHHNAGWEDNRQELELFVPEKNNLGDLETALKKSEPKQIFQPNEFTAYSNWGVALAGYIVERITGQAFYEYVHENIFDVLGMEHTAFNADLSDNLWVKEALGTLSDFIRFAMALLPNEKGYSPLFKKRDTLEQFYTTSLYYADKKTPRNSHGLWASYYSVPVIGYTGTLLISPTSGVGVVVMVNQPQERMYNYGMMPLIFGEYEAVNTNNMPDVAEMEGMYLCTRTTFSGMMKWTRLLPVIGIMPFSKSGDNMLLSPFYSHLINAKQIEPYTYNFNLLNINMMMKANVGDTKTMMSVPMWDYVKIDRKVVMFWSSTIILFMLAAVYATLSLILTLVCLIKRKTLKHLLKLRILNDISVILSFINLLLLVFSVISLKETYTSVSIRGIFFIIFAIIPVVFTTKWVLSLGKLECSKKYKKWLILSSATGLIMTFNVVFWNLYMIW